MNKNVMMGVVVSLFLSVGAYAQTQTEVYKVKPKFTSEQREAKRAEMKDKLARMTPAERKAFKQEHRAQMQARLNDMTPEKRAKVMERRRQRKEMHDQGSK